MWHTLCSALRLLLFLWSSKHRSLIRDGCPNFCTSASFIIIHKKKKRTSFKRSNFRNRSFFLQLVFCTWFHKRELLRLKIFWNRHNWGTVLQSRTWDPLAIQWFSFRMKDVPSTTIYFILSFFMERANIITINVVCVWGAEILLFLFSLFFFKIVVFPPK